MFSNNFTSHDQNSKKYNDAGKGNKINHSTNLNRESETPKERQQSKWPRTKKVFWSDKRKLNIKWQLKIFMTFSTRYRDHREHKQHIKHAAETLWSDNKYREENGVVCNKYTV